MTTFDELIINGEAELKLAKDRRDRELAVVKAVHETARKEGRAELSTTENDEVDRAMEAHKRAQAAVDGANRKLEQLRVAKGLEDRTDEKLADKREDPETRDGKKASRDEHVKVGREERTYHQGNDPSGKEFLRDVALQFMFRDPMAGVRLERHMREERFERDAKYFQRAAGDATTTNFSGLTVPQYLTEMYAPKARALRPFADACNKHNLPAQGMSLYLSQITTGSSAALQANELDAASATSIDDTPLTINVQTAAGQQTMSRQAIERGTGTEEVTMDDLQRAWATVLDSTLINQATTGLTNKATGTTFDDTSPTGVELYPKILGALAGVEAVLLGQARPDLAVMHSRRWYWLSKEMTTSWPLVGQPNINPQNIGVNYAEIYGAGVRGVLPNGTVVIVDNNVPTNLGAGTNQDEIYIVASDECHLWEDPNAPQFIRAEQPKAANLGVLLVLYSYFAYTFDRFGAGSAAKIGGTGLVTPTF